MHRVFLEVCACGIFGVFEFIFFPSKQIQCPINKERGEVKGRLIWLIVCL